MSVQSVTTEVPTDVSAAADIAPEAQLSTNSLELVSEQPTNRWMGLAAVSLLFLGAGTILAEPSVVLLSALGLGYVLYDRLQQPKPIELGVTRTLSEPTPDVDDEVAITLTIKNIGQRPVTDLRVIDGVPSSIEVSEGTPRRATALRPGQESTFNYKIEATRGYHAFDPVTLIVRDIAGTYERVFSAEVPSELHGHADDDPFPPVTLRQLASGVVGRIETSEGGPGVEFHAVREYRPGDPLNRIDWNRRARSGELATVDFRREQMATVMLVIDIRPSAHVGRPEDERPASERCIEAAASMFIGLLDAGDRVGITTLGTRSLWLPPGMGADHREHGRLLFTRHPSLAGRPAEGTVSVASEEWALDHRIPDSTQLVFITPLADGGASRYATRFEARGHPVTILSPDPCGDDTTGRLVANIERQFRIKRLRADGIRVLDWDYSEDSLPTLIERFSERWSR